MNEKHQEILSRLFRKKRSNDVHFTMDGKLYRATSCKGSVRFDSLGETVDRGIPVDYWNPLYDVNTACVATEWLLSDLGYLDFKKSIISHTPYLRRALFHVDEGGGKFRFVQALITESRLLSSSVKLFAALTADSVSNVLDQRDVVPILFQAGDYLYRIPAEAKDLCGEVRPMLVVDNLPFEDPVPAASLSLVPYEGYRPYY